MRRNSPVLPPGTRSSIWMKRTGKPWTSFQESNVNCGNMRTSILLWILLLVAGGFTNVRGENVLVEKANKAYTDGMYAEAADLYKKVAASGYAAPELYYNLGNACFKLNDFPGAILWYERARRLDPGNEDITFNLNVANSKIADKIEPVPEMFYRR